MKIRIDADDIPTIIEHAQERSAEQRVRWATGASGYRRASDQNRRNRL